MHLVETEGWTFVPNDELERLKAKEAPAPKVAVLKCNTCNTELLQVNLTNPDRVATNGATFLNGLAKLSPECPHGPLMSRRHDRTRSEAVERGKPDDPHCAECGRATNDRWLCEYCLVVDSFVV